MSGSAGETGRLDLWLKLVCLYKQRSEATAAVRGGLVKVNGVRVKPATTVSAGDVVEITSPRYRKVVVEEIPHGSVAKSVARTMYRDETPELPKSDLPAPSGARERGAGRPTKKQRREIEKYRF
jgi:ribosome-associated heat shock protein Hsp15